MHKEFEDGSFFEVKPLENKEEILVSICARDSSNPQIVTILSVKMNKKDFINIADQVKAE